MTAGGPVSFDYDGRTFRPGDEDPAYTSQAHYHQDGDLVWAEFTGGHVRRGSLAGTCGPGGVLEFAYCMVRDSGEVISGFCRSTPRRLADGRIRLDEQWQRYTPQPGRGLSFIEEVPPAAHPRR